MNLQFPQDRSVQQEATKPESGAAQMSFGFGVGQEAWDPASLSLRLAFACLYVFSRMLQQPALLMPVYFRCDSSRYGTETHTPMEGWGGALWTLVEDQTLAESFASLTWSSGTDPDYSEIDAVLCIGSLVELDVGHVSGKSMVLGVLFQESDSPRVHLEMRFDETRIARASAQDMLEKIALVCEALDSKPNQRVGLLELLTRTATQIIPDLRRELPVEPQPMVPKVFRDVALRYWSEPAISGRGGVYTYGGLWTQVADLAAQLRELGLAPGDIVAIAGVSSFGTIAAMLATLLAGGVIVTLDQSLPAERLSRIAAICQPRVTVSVLAAHGVGMRAPTDGEIVVVDWPMQGQSPPEADWRDFDIGTAMTDDASAYVFFTSGSTGEPKGVLGTHLGLAHFLNWQRSNFPIGPGDRNAQLTALSFDVVLRDILFPLTSGACLCIPERDSLFDARKILAWMASSNITVMHSVPSLMKAWLQAEHGQRPFQSIRFIFFAGEPLTDTLIMRFREAASPDALIINLYGPTETTLAKLCNPILQVESGVQPVGYAQPGAEAVVMRDRSVLCGLWEIGEIVIRTPYRSKGYLHQEELTRQVFIPNPLRDDANDLIYCTGDLGRFRPDGKIEIFGRIDSQIKIRGVRIEPNEIESELTKIEFIKDAAISARLNSLDEKFLVAFVVLRESSGAGADPAERPQQIRSRLRDALHDAMVPSRFMFVDELPYLPNGKLNRKMIAEYDIETMDDGGDTKQLLKSVKAAHLPVIAQIEAVLGRPVYSIDQSFVALGGDSLSYIRVSLVLEDFLGALPLEWEKMPLRTLLDSVSSKPVSSYWADVEVPLFFRAVGILLVVLSHTGVVGLSGTTVLFVISGISFGKFLRPTIFQTKSLKGVFRFILRYGIPAALWQLLRSVTFHRFWLPDLLLLGTMFQKPGDGHWTLWYLDILTANLLLLSVIAMQEVRRRGANETAGDTAHDSRRFGIDFGVILVGMALAVAQVSSGWWDGKLGFTNVGPFRWFWLLAYGVAVSQASSLRQKMLLTGLLVVTLVTTGLGLPMLGPVFDFLDVLFYGAMLAILWLEIIPIPRVLKGVVVEVASASLFIYIVNVAVIGQILPRLGVPPWWLWQTLAAVAVGVVANRVWNRFLEILGRWTTRLRTKK